MGKAFGQLRRAPLTLTLSPEYGGEGKEPDPSEYLKLTLAVFEYAIEHLTR